MKAQTDISSLTLQQAWNNAINALLGFETNPANYFYRAYQLRDCVASAWLKEDKDLTHLTADKQGEILKAVEITPNQLYNLKQSNVLYEMEIVLDVLQTFCKENPNFGKNPFYCAFFNIRIVGRIISENNFPQKKLNSGLAIKHREWAQALKQCFELAQICTEEGVEEKDFPLYFEAYLRLISDAVGQSLFETKGYAYQMAYLNILCNEPSHQWTTQRRNLNAYYAEGLLKTTTDRTTDRRRFASYYAAARMKGNNETTAKVYAEMKVRGYSETLSTQRRMQKFFESVSEETLKKCEDTTRLMLQRGFSLDFTDAYIAKSLIQKRSKEFATAYAIYRTQHGYGPYRSNIRAFFAWLGFKLRFTAAPVAKVEDQKEPSEQFTPKQLFEVVHSKVMRENPNFSRQYSKEKKRTWIEKNFSFLFRSGPTFTEEENTKSVRLLKSLNNSSNLI